jgi:3-hydroxyisobutyrate dehydrogenase-like beta-hydroxyacid dehydrogenase
LPPISKSLFVFFSINNVARNTVSVLREAAVVDVDIIVVCVVQSAQVLVIFSMPFGISARTVIDSSTHA